MSVRLLAVALVGCGRIGFDAPSSDATGDASVDARMCAGFGPWTTPVALTELDDPIANEYGPSIMPDGLTIYFDSDRTGPTNVYVAKRPNPTAPFGAPMRLASLATGDADGDPTLTGDELDVYLYDATAHCVDHARRTSTTDTFSTPATVFCMNAGPFVTLDGLTLYYNSYVDATAEGELYVSTRASRDVEFGAGTKISELATGGGRGFPSLTADGLSLYFEQETTNALDLMETHRASLGSPWDPPASIDALNSPVEDGDVNVSADGTEIFFESSRGSGQADLYHSTRACL